MPNGEKIARGFLLGILCCFLMIWAHNRAVKGSEAEIQKIYITKEFWKSACLRYKGLYIQSDYENKHLRTDSAKAFRYSVTVYKNINN